MGLRSCRSRLLVPLLSLFLVAAAAPSTEQGAVRAARAALDHARLDQAEQIIDDALKRFGTRDSEAVWSLRVMRGEAFNARGDPNGARSALAFELPSKYRRTETAVRRLLMLGFAAFLLRDTAQTRNLLEEARTLAAEHQPAALADVLNGMVTTGLDPSRVEENTREAIRLARAHGRKTTEVKALASLAYALVAQQRYAEAIQWGEQALPLARTLEMTKIVGSIEGNLGWAHYEIGDYETAEELFQRAQATAVRIGAKSDIVAWLIQLGNIRHQQRDWAGADRYNRAAVAVGTPIKDSQVGFALANIARASIELGRFDEARRFNAEALEWKRARQGVEAELASHVVDARIATLVGEHARAEKLLRNVIRDTKRVSTRAEAEGRLAQLHARQRREKLADTHFQRALEAAREARDEVKDRELRFSFFNSVAEIFGTYVDFLAASNRPEDALAVTETSRAQSLEEGLKLRAAPRKLDPRTIAKQNDATILCYWLGRDRSYLWVVTPAAVSLHRLPPDTTIEKTVEAYRRDLLGPRGGLQTSGARGQELYRWLVEPASRAIARGSRVIVVADGKLHALNFETLVVPSPQRYWIEDVVVMNAGSLQLLGRNDAKPAAAPAILLVGNAPSPDPSFPPLLHAAAEMRAIARRFSRRVVLDGPKATPSAYHAASPGKFEYVHFVAHGVATRRRPLDSAVILARDASNSYKLLARDVVAEPLTARLVTISSCHGAGTRTYAGEGVVGLAWAFLRAGAGQVIASLWEVNDAATPQLMDKMYASIRAGRDPAVALRDAKLTLVRSAGAYRRPLYWAPFVLYSGT